jgi:hypothetical protein
MTSADPNIPRNWLFQERYENDLDGSRGRARLVASARSA